VSEPSLISVIIPAWNARPFLRQALESVLAQQGVALEVIVIDDCSPDPLDDIVRDLADRRLKYLRLPQNRGPGGARNFGIDQAQGAWIAVLDADDLFGPDRLSMLIQIAQEAGADIVADNLRRTSFEAPFGAIGALHLDEQLDGALEEIDFARFAQQNRIFQGAPLLGYLKPMFRSSFLNAHALRYDEQLRIGEDYQIVAEALLAGARYVRVRQARYIYRSRPGSISHRLGQAEIEAMVLAEDRICERWRGQMSRGELRAQTRRMNSLFDARAFVGMVEALKAKDFARAALLGLGRPAALRHLAMPISARLRPRAFAS
jgi:succinoglycan biosynthesis protein ExoO